MIDSLPVHGQGVFIFNTVQDISSCTFRLISTESEANELLIEFSMSSVSVRQLPALTPLTDPTNTQGLSPLKGAYYWFSLDAQNQCLYAGVGEARLETAVYSYQFTPSNTTKAFLESITTVAYSPDVIQPRRILSDPITNKIPLTVKDTHELTMEHIASTAYMPKANLSHIGQKLYECISGKQFVLNTPDFPDFTQAIEYSIRTPGLWCYQKLRDKSREFNPDIPDLSETYLRITLGQNNGESPGIPYVMEIWPVGHYSPIHSHSSANAIIRVLSGEIHVSLYPFLCTEKAGVKPFAEAIFKEGDVTWVTPTLNQTHQLKNLETNTYTCVTIQCYMYTEGDRRHYDYFDYIDANGKKQLYEPDSDMDFIDFKKKIREEWDARPRSAPVVEAAFCGCLPRRRPAAAPGLTHTQS